MLAGKKFSADEEVITENEVYFEAKDKLYYKNGIEKLTAIIVVSSLKVTILNNKIKFYLKNIFFYVTLRTFQPTCHCLGVYAFDPRVWKANLKLNQNN